MLAKALVVYFMCDLWTYYFILFLYRKLCSGFAYSILLNKTLPCLTIPYMILRLIPYYCIDFSKQCATMKKKTD